MQKIETAIGNRIGQQSAQEFREWMDKLKKLRPMARRGLALFLVASFLHFSTNIIDTSVKAKEEDEEKKPLVKDSTRDEEEGEPKSENRIIVLDYFESYRQMYEGLLGANLDEFMAWGETNGIMNFLRSSFRSATEITSIVSIFYCDRNIAILNDIEVENNMAPNTLVNAVYESSDIGEQIISTPFTKDEWVSWFIMASDPSSGYIINPAITVLLSN